MVSFYEVSKLQVCRHFFPAKFKFKFVTLFVKIFDNLFHFLKGQSGCVSINLNRDDSELQAEPLIMVAQEYVLSIKIMLTALKFITSYIASKRRWHLTSMILY